MDKLLGKYALIHDTVGDYNSCGMMLRIKDFRMSSSFLPMNSLYWENDACSGSDFKYLYYEDTNMMRIKKFHKGHDFD